MSRDDVEHILAKLRALKPEIAARYRVRELGVFGSFSRGEQGEASDIDLLVDFEEGADLLDLVGLAQFLEEQFHRPIDVVPKRALRAEIRKAVLEEVVPL